MKGGAAASVAINSVWVMKWLVSASHLAGSRAQLRGGSGRRNRHGEIFEDGRGIGQVG